MEKIFKLLTLLLLAALLSMQLYKAFLGGHVWRDDMSFANVSKSVAAGEGYQSVFFDKSYPFNVSVTTGPILIMPASLLIKLFGNQYWVPGLASAIMTLLGFILIFTALKPILKYEIWGGCCTGLVLLLLSTFTETEKQYYYIWYLMMGEALAILLVVAAICFGCSGLPVASGVSASQDTRSAFLSGLCFSFAFLTKVITIFGAIGFALVAGLWLLFTTRRISSLWSLRWQLAGFAAPVAMYELIKLISLGMVGYMQFYHLRMQQIHYQGLSNGNPQGRAMQIISRISVALHSPLFFHAAVTACAVFFFVILVTMLLKTKQKIIPVSPDTRAPLKLLALAMGGAFITHSFWWVAYSDGNDRYLIECAGYGAGAVVAAIMLLSYPKRLSLLIAVIAGAAVFQYSAVTYLFNSAYQPDKTMPQMLSARMELIHIRQLGYRIYSCGVNFELEYLMPTSRNFYDCTVMEKYHKAHPEEKIAFFTFYHEGKTIRLDNSSALVTSYAIPPAILKACNVSYTNYGKSVIKLCYIAP